MIQQAIPIRKEFRETVKNYCLANNIRWSVVYSECWHEGVIGTPKQYETTYPKTTKGICYIFC